MEEDLNIGLFIVYRLIIMSKKANKIHSFSEFEKYDLIVLWGAEEVLYHSTHVDYFNNTKRTSVLKRIATDMTKH